LPEAKTDDLGQIKDRALRTGLRSREFDPTETPRLGATEAIRAVAVSRGVIVPLLAAEFRESTVHNIRGAFVSGVSHALEKPTLLMRHGDWAVPLDVRDDTESFRNSTQLGVLIANFAGRVHDLMFSISSTTRSRPNRLSELYLGDPSAENEEVRLGEYFLERGEYRQVLEQRASIVVGRKESGKTAVCVRARDQLKSDRAKVVVDLSPRTHQLKRLKDLVLQWLAAGSKEFLLTAFWEYVLLLEISGKILEKDQDVHKRNHKLFELYQILLAIFNTELSTSSVDFSDRLQMLIDRISLKYVETFGRRPETAITEDSLTNIIYRTALSDLKVAIERYIQNKQGVYVLFDNLDKGWNASGLENADIVIVRTLLDASRKLENDFRRSGNYISLYYISSQ
jgi:hypothetical protein